MVSYECQDSGSTPESAKNTAYNIMRYILEHEKVPIIFDKVLNVLIFTKYISCYTEFGAGPLEKNRHEPLLK